MESPSDFKFQLDVRKDPKNFFYVYEIVKGKTDEGKADRLVAHLNAEAFEYYFENFTE